MTPIYHAGPQFPKANVWTIALAILCALWLTPCTLVVSILLPRRRQRFYDTLTAFLKSVAGE